MDIILYNPRTFNKKPSSDVKTFAWAGAQWQGLKVNSMARYPEHVAKEMIKRFGFLQEVMPEDLERVQKLIDAKSLICEYCGDEFESDKALQGHIIGKHKLSNELQSKLMSVPAAARKEVGQKMPDTNPELLEGIPDTKKGEVDGWFGPGLENDAPEKVGVTNL